MVEVGRKSMFGAAQSYQILVQNVVHCALPPSGEFHRIPALAAASNCGFGHSNRCAVVSLCPFSLQIPGEVEWGTLNVLIYHLHTSFGEVFVQISRTFLI